MPSVQGWGRAGRAVLQVQTAAAPVRTKKIPVYIFQRRTAALSPLQAGRLLTQVDGYVGPSLATPPSGQQDSRADRRITHPTQGEQHETSDYTHSRLQQRQRP